MGIFIVTARVREVQGVWERTYMVQADTADKASAKIHNLDRENVQVLSVGSSTEGSIHVLKQKRWTG